MKTKKEEKEEKQRNNNIHQQFGELPSIELTTATASEHSPVVSQSHICITGLTLREALNSLYELKKKGYWKIKEVKQK